jgi:glycine/D-amino acid oxidase-like deaminating enzyme
MAPTVPFEHADKSFWLATYGPYAPSPALRGDLTVDVAIIGAGFTGLSTAYNLRRDDAGIRVAVLESEIVGYGASGRNGGFSMTLFGFEPSVTKLFFGGARTREAQRYMERAVDYVDDLVRRHEMQSDYWRSGFLRAATTPAYAKRIRRDLDILLGLGITGIEWIDADQVRARVRSPLFLGAWWEPRCGLLNPAKHVRELKRVAESAGAAVYEHTPVTDIQLGSPNVLRTAGGTIRADKIVIAANAYSHLIPHLRQKQAAVFTHMVITEPLDDAQRASLGWAGREGIEDARNLVHYLRLTDDNRLAIGGSDVSLAYGQSMEHDCNTRVFADLERDVGRLFPPLGGVRFTHRWGGPVSVPPQLVPEIGTLQGGRAHYSLGCVGHGVSLTHLNGQTLADLVRGRKTDLTDVWFVNKRSIPWPPEPLRYLLAQTIRGYFRLEDRWHERHLAS